MKTPEQRQWRRSGVFIVNFEHISPLCYLLKANNGNTRFNFEQNSHIVPVFFMDDFKQVKRS